MPGSARRVSSPPGISLPKIGAVKVKWSRPLPATPSSVTVVKDAAGRCFASFVLDADPAADQARMRETENTVGIDLGFTHFAVGSDGTNVDSPRFLRHASAVEDLSVAGLAERYGRTLVKTAAGHWRYRPAERR